MIPPPLSDAYVAGLLDGEGCIWIEQNKLKYYSARIDVGMTSRALPILRQLLREVGGSLHLQRAATDRWEAAWMWVASGPTAGALLQRVGSLLRVKGPQADRALHLEKIKASLPTHRNGTLQWTDAVRTEAERLRQEILALNRKGPLIPMRPGTSARLVGGQWLTPQQSLYDDGPWGKFSETWPTSGMGWNSEFLIVNSSESPSDAVACSLSAIVEATVPRRFSLSPRAAVGILRRAEKRGRTLPDALQRALTALATTATRRPL